MKKSDVIFLFLAIFLTAVITLAVLAYNNQVELPIDPCFNKAMVGNCIIR